MSKSFTTPEKKKPDSSPSLQQGFCTPEKKKPDSSPSLQEGFCTPEKKKPASSQLPRRELKPPPPDTIEMILAKMMGYDFSKKYHIQMEDRVNNSQKMQIMLYTLNSLSHFFDNLNCRNARYTYEADYKNDLEWIEDHRFRYVVNSEGQLLFSREGEPNSITPTHYQMGGYIYRVAGILMFAAGQMYFNEANKIDYINNLSGGFRGDAESLAWPLVLIDLFKPELLEDKIKLGVYNVAQKKIIEYFITRSDIQPLKHSLLRYFQSKELESINLLNKKPCYRLSLKTTQKGPESSFEQVDVEINSNEVKKNISGQQHVVYDDLSSLFQDVDLFSESLSQEPGDSASFDGGISDPQMPIPFHGKAKDEAQDKGSLGSEEEVIVSRNQSDSPVQKRKIIWNMFPDQMSARNQPLPLDNLSRKKVKVEHHPLMSLGS